MSTLASLLCTFVSACRSLFPSELASRLRFLIFSETVFSNVERHVVIYQNMDLQWAAAFGSLALTDVKIRENVLYSEVIRRRHGTIF